MKILLTKASNSFWYKIITISDINDLFKIIKKEDCPIIIEKNENKNCYDFLKTFWKGMTSADAKEIASLIDYKITIYDDFIE